MMYQPAFPSEHMATQQRSGMELRDYFAAQVIAQCREHCLTNKAAAEDAYSVADAMMEARKS